MVRLFAYGFVSILWGEKHEILPKSEHVSARAIFQVLQQKKLKFSEFQKMAAWHLMLCTINCHWP